MSEKELDIAAYLKGVAANPRTRKVSPRRPQSLEEQARANVVWGVNPGDDIAEKLRGAPEPEPGTRDTITAGDRGDDVKALQAALARRGFEVPVDGFFGPVTWSAVRGFQAQANLVPDGVVGAVTRRALEL